MATRSVPRSRGIDFPATAQLPVYLTPLVGRSRELAEVVGLLRDGRLVSLVGAGGSGKTRLAAAVALEFRESSRGQVGWVDLAALADPTMVACHTASTLGLREQPGRSSTDSLIELIGRSPVLLVLDNCEHLVEGCAVLVDALLRGCPALRVLATSRQALGVTGEKSWLVPPLALPGPGDPCVAGAGAVQLFVQRASDVLPSFALTEANAEAVVRICRRLDGLPLAIELAAARVKLLPPEQLAGRLDNAFALLASSSQVVLPRHRTLRALIDWSYELLSPAERTLFQRLAVFSGGCTLEAAECVVAGDGLESHEVLDLLAALVDKSLVSMRECQGEARYVLLETVRQYAQEQLGRCTPGGAEVERLRGRHALHYVEYAERAAPRLHGPAQLEWLARMDAEHDNLRAALAWCVAAGQADAVLRLCGAMRDFWRLRGHLSEGAHWIEEALRVPGGSGSLRARALVGAAVFGRMQGDYLSLRERLAESEALARGVGDRTALADALTQLGIDLRDRRDLATARERLDEALALWRETDDARGLSLALGVRSSLALAEGETACARALRLEAVEVASRAADREGQARALIGLGEIARIEGDLRSARACYERCLPLFRELGDTWHAAAVHHNLGWVAAETGGVEEAYHAFSESIALFGTAGGNPFGLTLCLFGLARALHEGGDSGSAAVALAAAAAQAARVGEGIAAPADVGCCERTRAAVEAAVDAEGLARAREVGERLELSQSIAWARQKLDALLPRHADPAPPAAARAAEQPAPPPLPDASLAPDLSVRALGPLRILAGERPLEGEAFGSSKPRELLLLLLCHPEGCTREQVGLAFWPESSAAQVKNSFHVTLHRLRKALGHPEWVVTAGERYQLDPALRVDFDARSFEAGVRAALREAGAGGDAGAALDAALALYQGDFLEGEVVGDWHLEVRERLRRLFAEGLLARGRMLMEEERFAEAADAFRSLLARDRLHEEACRQLMVCLARTGDRIGALRLYESLCVLLRDELDTGPDETTTALYERLRAETP